MKAIVFFLATFMLVCGNTFAETNTTPFFVGKLEKKWKFPSDHLPIGATIHKARIASWNILNEEYISFIFDNGQGLNKSLITQLAKVQDGDSLSLRERVVFDECLAMTKGKHKRSLIGLLETSKHLLHHFRNHLPRGWSCLFPHSKNHREDIFLYDKKRLRIIAAIAIPYNESSPKVVFSLKLQDKKTKAIFCVILTHVPGAGQGLTQMASIVQGLFDPSLKTIVMGDMNASPDAVTTALHNEGLAFHPRVTRYPTHINTQRKACWFDAFFVYTPTKKRFLKTDPASHLFTSSHTHIHSKKIQVFGVKEAAHLLNERR